MVRCWKSYHAVLLAPRGPRRWVLTDHQGYTPNPHPHLTHQQPLGLIPSQFIHVGFTQKDKNPGITELGGGALVVVVGRGGGVVYMLSAVGSWIIRMGYTRVVGNLCWLLHPGCWPVRGPPLDIWWGFLPGHFFSFHKGDGKLIFSPQDKLYFHHALWLYLFHPFFPQNNLLPKKLQASRSILMAVPLRRWRGVCCTSLG